MTAKELVELQSAVAEAIEEKRVSEREAIKAKAAQLAAEAGLSISDLFGKSGKRGKAAPKYRNPANAAETWTGRGRKPNWMVAALKKGVKLEKMLIA